jgi:hypothetical protein
MDDSIQHKPGFSNDGERVPVVMRLEIVDGTDSGDEARIREETIVRFVIWLIQDCKSDCNEIGRRVSLLAHELKKIPGAPQSNNELATRLDVHPSISSRLVKAFKNEWKLP